jgi:hypothetical protein
MTRRRRHFHPMMFEEVFHVATGEGGENLSAAWLFISSFFRDEVPWLSEVALQLHRAHQLGDAQLIEGAQRNLRDITRMARHSRMFMRGPEDEEAHMLMRHLPDMLEHTGLLRPPKDRRSKKTKEDTAPEPSQESKA